MLENEVQAKPTLPNGWIWTTLGEVITISQNGFGKRRSEEGSPTIVLRLADIVDGERISFDEVRRIRLKGDEIEKYQLLANDLLCIRVNGSPSLVGRMIPFTTYSEPVAFCDHFIRFQFAMPDFASFLSMYFDTDRARKYIDLNKVSSAGQNTISQRTMTGMEVPLAPLPEQHRIVAEIEKQLTRLDAGVAALRRVQANLRRYKAAVLKAACEGQLVPQDAADEPASALLERILAERRARWEAEQVTKGKDPKKLKYKEPVAPDREGLPEVPEGWVWASAEQLCAFITKGTTPKSNKLFDGEGDIPFIKVYNLTFNGHLDFTIKPTFVSYETHSQELARSLVLPGDVLMNIVGPPLGKVSIVPDVYPEWNMNQAVARFRPMPSYSRKFLSYALMAEPILSWATRRAKATAGQFNLTLQICRELPLPVPPLAEQQRIVAEVERRLSVVEGLEASIEANLKRAERLRQAVLKRAFAGELVPQDPDDEPASVLLSRIRAEREKEKRKKPGFFKKPGF